MFSTHGIASESEPKPRTAFRNPIVLALELAEKMKRGGISRAELARRNAMSRARVTQWLSLLDLPKIEIDRVLAMGDYRERRLVTERELRRQGSQYRIQSGDSTAYVTGRNSSHFYSK